MLLYDRNVFVSAVLERLDVCVWWVVTVRVRVMIRVRARVRVRVRVRVMQECSARTSRRLCLVGG